MASPDTRVAFVSGDRLPGWVERFRASHGELQEEPTTPACGCWRPTAPPPCCMPPWPDGGRPGRGDDSVARLASPGLPAAAARPGAGAPGRVLGGGGVRRPGARVEDRNPARPVPHGGRRLVPAAFRPAPRQPGGRPGGGRGRACRPDFRGPQRRIPRPRRGPHPGRAGARRTRAQTLRGAAPDCRSWTSRTRARPC